MTRLVLTGDARRFVASARVGRLATSTPGGRPHVVPVCFAVADDDIYVGLDAKPKSVDVSKLRRVRNIIRNPQASLLIDRYSEDWEQLGFVLITADAQLVSNEEERTGAVRALRHKYVQYHVLLSDDAPVIRLKAVHVTSWGDLTPWETAFVGGAETPQPGRPHEAGLIDRSAGS